MPHTVYIVHPIKYLLIILTLFLPTPKQTQCSQCSMPMDVSKIRKYSLFLGFQVSRVSVAEP